MCKQKIVLDMIKQKADKAGLSADVIFMAEKQCEDCEMMDKRMTAIENKVDDLRRDLKEQGNDIANIRNSIDEIKELITKKNSFWENIKEIISNKVFLYLLLVIIALTCGVPIAQLGLALLQ